MVNYYAEIEFKFLIDYGNGETIGIEMSVSRSL